MRPPAPALARPRRPRGSIQRVAAAARRPRAIPAARVGGRGRSTPTRPAAGSAVPSAAPSPRRRGRCCSPTPAADARRRDSAASNVRSNLASVMRARPRHTRRQAGQPQPLGRRVLQHEHDLEERRVAQSALGLKLLDQLLEGHVLVREGPERHLAHPPQQLAEGRVARDVGAQRQRVDEEADQPLGLDARCGRRSASRRRCRPGRCSGAAAALKAASSVMNSVAPSRRPSC